MFCEVETADEWLGTLSRPLLVVGNAVLSRPVREDGFASIIRMNNYAVDARSGRKITHWVTSGYMNVKLPANFTGPAFIPWSREFNQLRPIRWDLEFAKRYPGRVIFTDSDAHLGGWFSKNAAEVPSTGFCLLAWLVFRRVRGTLVGFDGMKTGHQSNPAHRHDHLFTRRKEWRIIQFWIQQKLWTI